MSRRLEDLAPAARSAAERAISTIKAHGVQVVVTCIPNNAQEVPVCC